MPLVCIASWGEYFDYYLVPTPKVPYLLQQILKLVLASF